MSAGSRSGNITTQASHGQPAHRGADQERYECLLDLGLYTAPIGMGSRPYTDVYAHFQVLRTTT